MPIKNTLQLPPRIFTLQKAMQWKIKSLAQSCAVSGDKFKPNEAIVCFLYRDTAGELHRSDMRPENVEAFERPKRILARWTRAALSETQSEAEARKQALKNAETLFLGLFDSHAEPRAEDETLKQILGLLLERKRILRARGFNDKREQRYFHAASDREYLVPIKSIPPENLLAVQDQLETLIP